MIARVLVFRTVLEALLLAPLDDDDGQVDQLLRAAAAVQDLTQVEDLTPQNVHLLLGKT